MKREPPQMPDLRLRLPMAAALTLGALAVAAWAIVAAFASAPQAPANHTQNAETAVALPEPRVVDPSPPSPVGSRPQTLREVLTAIEREHGIKIVMDRDLPVSGPAAIDPAGLSPEEALKQALKGFDLFFHYVPSQKSGALELKRVWVVAHDRGGSMEVMAKPAQSSSGLESADPQQRVAALHRLGQQSGSDSQEALIWALADPDDNVRQQALIAAQANGLPIPVETLETLLTSDPSEVVRGSALEALSLNPESDPYRMQALLDQARRDPSEAVRELAANLLSSFSPPSDEPTESASGSVSAEATAATPFDASAESGSGNASTGAPRQ